MSKYIANENRYEKMQYRRCGKSGIKLPLLSLGLWHNFGDNDDFENARNILRTAFNNGITHFDLANNYGPPYGSAEKNFGKIFAEDFKQYRDELLISTKAGWDMWPGPLEETMGALDQVVRQGKALYVGISQYSSKDTARAAEILRAQKTPFLIHQPRYNMMDRWVENGLLNTLEHEGIGSIVFSPLEQGILTDKYLNGIPKDSRAATQGSYLDESQITPEVVKKVQALNEIAQSRNQSLAQMAVAWLLKDKRVTSVLVGASKVSQLEDNIKAIENLEFNKIELEKIEEILKNK